MSTPNEFENEIRVIKEAVPEADEKAIAEEFTRYQNEFLIPPKEALHSVMKKFQTDAGVEVTASPLRSASSRPAAKSVERFSELKNDDKNVTIEVEVVTYTPRMQTMKNGEEKQIAYGWIEDNPWEEGGERTRWDFKDWGNHAENLSPGSIVRLEGVTVNEWNGKFSLNVNAWSRIAVLRASERKQVMAPNEPVSINRVLEMDGFATVVARVIAKREQTVNRRDGSGTIDLVKGRLADDSGSIGFACFGSFEHPIGTLLKIDGASIRRFRDTPELNIGDRTKVEIYHDSGFASLDDLEKSAMVQIGQLRDGSTNVSIVVQLTSWSSRIITKKDGTEQTIWNGEVVDPTGSCRLNAWSEIPIDEGNLPMALRLSNIRVRSWQGVPDLTVDNAGQVEILDEIPWEVIDASAHTVDVEFHELITGSSRNGVSSTATIVSITPSSGIIHRCPECRRAMQDGACREHGAQKGVEDLRLMLVMDNGLSNATLILSKDVAESFLEQSFDQIRDAIQSNGSDSFIAELRAKVVGKRFTFTGRAMIDTQGALLMADTFVPAEEDPKEMSDIVRQRWEVFA